MFPRISRLGARLLRESRAETRAGWYLYFPLSSFPSMIGGLLVIGLLLISCGEILLTCVYLAVDTNVSCVLASGFS
jgi:heme/copper-type cytochrome/quinol oxidase subunit 1